MEIVKSAEKLFCKHLIIFASFLRHEFRFCQPARSLFYYPKNKMRRKRNSDFYERITSERTKIVSHLPVCINSCLQQGVFVVKAINDGCFNGRRGRVRQAYNCLIEI